MHNYENWQLKDIKHSFSFYATITTTHFCLKAFIAWVFRIPYKESDLNSSWCPVAEFLRRTVPSPALQIKASASCKCDHPSSNTGNINKPIFRCEWYIGDLILTFHSVKWRSNTHSHILFLKKLFICHTIKNIRIFIICWIFFFKLLSETCCIYIKQS